jgi:hypothetical protein
MDSPFNTNVINSTGGVGVLQTQSAKYGDNPFLQLSCATRRRSNRSTTRAS